MDIELLVVPDCPNEAAAATQLRELLDERGLADTPVRTTVIGTQHEAELRGFIGSPTFLIDDVDPFADPERAPAVACRIYPGAGGVGGFPERALLGWVLGEAANLG